MRGLVDAMHDCALSKDDRRAIYMRMIPVLQDQDWDNECDCIGIDLVLDEAFKRLHPDWFDGRPLPVDQTKLIQKTTEWWIDLEPLLMDAGPNCRHHLERMRGVRYHLEEGYPVDVLMYLRQWITWLSTWEKHFPEVKRIIKQMVEFLP